MGTDPLLNILETIAINTGGLSLSTPTADPLMNLLTNIANNTASFTKVPKMIAALPAAVSVPAAQTTETTLWTVSIPAMSGYDRLITSLSFGGTGTAGNKTYKLYFGGVVLGTSGIVNTNSSACLNVDIQCMNSTTAKVFINTGISSTSVLTGAFTLDTSTAQNFVVTATVANAADTAQLTSGVVYLSKGV